MYAQDEVTIERAKARQAALEHEREGYEARIAGKKAGRFGGIGEDLSVKQLEDRVAQVNAEIKSAKSDVNAAKKKRDAGDDEPADESEPEAA